MCHDLYGVYCLMENIDIEWRQRKKKYSKSMGNFGFDGSMAWPWNQLISDDQKKTIKFEFSKRKKQTSIPYTRTKHLQSTINKW